MQLRIKKLTEDDAPAFITFMENVDFSPTPHWATCFCRFYYTDCSMADWVKRSGARNQVEAAREIQRGNMSGYLAFDGLKCIAWLNAADVTKLIRITKEVGPYVENEKTACTICFVVDPKYRRQGVASAMLKQAIADFKMDGYQTMLAIPFDLKSDKQKEYRGPVAMYKKLGYEELAVNEQVHILKLSLKE